MAGKRKATKGKNVVVNEKTCIDCAHSRNYQDITYDGKYILCRCDFKKHCIFLYKDWCENFKGKLVS